MALSQEFENLLEQREGLQDRALDLFDQRVEEYTENVARRLAAVLDVDPGIIPPQGDDGRMVGQSDFERRIAQLDGADRIRAGVLAASLQEIEDFCDMAGCDRIRASITDIVPELAGGSEVMFQISAGDKADAVGAIGALDTVGAEALIGNYIDSLDDKLRRTIDSQSAIRIKDALTHGLTLGTVGDLADRIERDEMERVLKERVIENLSEEEARKIRQNAKTEARTSLSQADRFTSETVRQSVDPEGKIFLLWYQGSKDSKNRPFCSHIAGLAFKIKDFDKLNNRQTSIHPRISGGGYNCRHKARPIEASQAKTLGIRIGTMEEINRANDAAQNSKKISKGRRRKRR